MFVASFVMKCVIFYNCVYVLKFQVEIMIFSCGKQLYRSSCSCVCRCIYLSVCLCVTFFVGTFVGTVFAKVVLDFFANVDFFHFFWYWLPLAAAIYECGAYLFQNAGRFAHFCAPFDPSGAPKWAKYWCVLKMDNIFKFLVSNIISDQICRFLQPFIRIWTSLPPFCAPFDLWGAPKWVKYQGILKMDNTVKFLVSNNIFDQICRFLQPFMSIWSSLFPFLPLLTPGVPQNG